MMGRVVFREMGQEPESNVTSDRHRFRPDPPLPSLSPHSACTEKLRTCEVLGSTGVFRTKARRLEEGPGGREH